MNGNQVTGFTFCYCTDYPQAECYPTNYCSNDPGQPNNTCYEGMHDEPERGLLIFPRHLENERGRPVAPTLALIRPAA